MRNFIFIALLNWFVIIGWGQHAFAAEGFFKLELNSLQTTKNGCRISFVAENRLTVQIDKSAVELVVFDAQQIIAQMLVLDLGTFVHGKTRVVQFDLTRKCSQISRLLINGFVECSGVNLTAEACLRKLKASSRSSVKFGS